MTDSARAAILGRIRSALGDVSAEPETLPPPGFRSRDESDPAALTASFAERVADYKVKVERCGQAAAAAAVARILAARGCQRLVVPADLPQDYLPEGFDFVPDHGRDTAAIAASDGVMTLCACAIAQTGTIVLDHTTGQGRRVLTLLPDYHLCIVPAERILGLVPEAVARTAEAVRAGRPLTFISGPSATSDIELNRVEGVHGPRTLDVLIVEA